MLRIKNKKREKKLINIQIQKPQKLCSGTETLKQGMPKKLAVNI